MPRWESFESFLDDVTSTPPDQRQLLVDELLAERPEWPWVEGDEATFVYSGLGTRSAALNLDMIRDDPPFASMIQLEGTSLWYLTRRFERDDLLDYLLAINDPMTPLSQERDVPSRVAQYWRADPRNPLRMNTAQMEVSVLRMEQARPLPDWRTFRAVPRGRVFEHSMSSLQLGFSGRKLWVYTPPNYNESTTEHPLLIFQDGQWAVGPLQLPYIADTLFKHGRMEPTVIAMIQSGAPHERLQEYAVSDKYYAFTLLELLPFLQTQYRIDATNLGIGGVAIGAIAAADAALKNPAVFERLLMISPPLGKGHDQQWRVEQLVRRFADARVLPQRVFQSVGRYESKTRFGRPAEALRDILSARRDVDYYFAEIGSGHGLVGFKSVLPEALAWAFPVGVQ